MDQEPEIYRVGFWRVFEGRQGSFIWLGLSLLALLFAALVRGWVGTFLSFGAILGLVGFSVHMAWSRRTLELWPDRIVLKGFLERRELRCRDIQGYRRTSRWVRVVMSPPEKGVWIRQEDPGDALGLWLDPLIDLNAADFQRQHEEFLADPRFGDTPEARQTLLDRWARVLNPLNIAAFGLAVTMLLWDFPPKALLVVGGLCPPLAVALVLVSRGVATLMPPSPTPRPTAAGLLLPGAALAFRALMDFNFVGGAKLNLATLLLCAVIAVVLLAADRRSFTSPRAITVLGLAALAYGWGSAMAADVDFDTGAPTTYRATVLDLTRSGSRHTTYHAALSAWGPFPAGHDLKISQRQYLNLEEGQTVCPRLHGGAFGAPWAEITPC